MFTEQNLKKEPHDVNGNRMYTTVCSNQQLVQSMSVGDRWKDRTDVRMQGVERQKLLADGVVVSWIMNYELTGSRDDAAIGVRVCLAICFLFGQRLSHAAVAVHTTRRYNAQHSSMRV